MFTRINKEKLHLINLPCIIIPFYDELKDCREYNKLVIERQEDLVKEVEAILSINNSYVEIKCVDKSYIVCNSTVGSFTITKFKELDESFSYQNRDKRRKKKTIEITQGCIKNIKIKSGDIEGNLTKGLSRSMKEKLFKFKEELIGRVIIVEYNSMHDKNLDFKLISLNG